MKQIIAERNPVLRGWGNYFRTGNADREFNRLDTFVYRRMHHWQIRRRGQAGDKAKGLDLRTALGDGAASAARHCAVSEAGHTKKIIVRLCAGKPHTQLCVQRILVRSVGGESHPYQRGNLSGSPDRVRTMPA